ncbi:FKBP-type peptidyl-prolyl cis-trans isomerase [Sphingobacterium faecale]|uniref:peptidylprolyl isomerase n=1 Tax=Sphingobacterium faecale TaxID=2803775 RepID=A0ABS1R821_9SPHI|nr:hypothetical protein [Sphingobacterium faecale]MBL1410871.1 hypothetical protein [Sphingobacterium faecale]
MKDSLPFKNNLYSMKNLFKTVLFAALGAIVFVSCNKKDTTDWNAEYLKQEKHIDSLLNKDKLKIEDYIDDTFQEDSVKIRFTFLNKSVKRGIWYKVTGTPTEEDEQAYKYEPNTSGYQGLPVVAPKVTLKYTARLLDGSTLSNGTLVENEESGEYDLGSSTTKVINSAWYVSFFPYSIRINEQDTRIIGGLTKTGLKKGSKITVVTPSYWAYQGLSTDKRPANSPLVYEFEVLSIKK